ncbi:MAG: thioredoxin family protein, partial [Actinomycetota bacterium]
MVKRDCPTCVEVAPVLAELQAAGGLTIFSQDDPDFPESASVTDDTSLAFSWHNDIETVPTLIRIEAGAETERIVGWRRDLWLDFTGAAKLAETDRDYLPGCGSLSVDPDLVDELERRFGNRTLSARRIELASSEDEHEMMYERGWSDGLPLVAPTEERVMAMLAGTTRDPSEVVAIVPPALVEVSVEQVAVNAVMAGCKPEYLPIVLAAVEG